MSILDPLPGDDQGAHFDELANAFLEQGELVSPAELHGCLCGMLGGGYSGDEGGLLAELEKTLDVTLHGTMADNVTALYDSVVVCLRDGEFDFQPLLPDDDLELPQRIEAMASWCRGFLSGYAQARVSAGAQADAVAPDSAEVLKDFAAIAQAGPDDSDDPHGGSDEESEDEYIELLEYIRVAAMNVLLDAGVGHDAESADPAL